MIMTGKVCYVELYAMVKDEKKKKKERGKKKHTHNQTASSMANVI